MTEVLTMRPIAAFRLWQTLAVLTSKHDLSFAFLEIDQIGKQKGVGPGLCVR